MPEIDFSLEAELDRLLAEDVSSVKKREQNAFDHLTAPFGKSLVLFGAGNLGHEVLMQLRKDGFEPKAFADNNPALWGKDLDGIKILSPQEAGNKFGQRTTFIVTIWNPGSSHQFRETKQKLQSLNCANVIPFISFFWKHPERFLPNCFLDLPHKIIAERDQIKNTFRLWKDESSKATFISQLKWRMWENYDNLLPSNGEIQYFPNILKLTSNEAFIDCGAFDGDTMKDFLARTNGNFSAIEAFEPDPINFNKLSRFIQTYSKRAKINLHQKAVGARFETLNFSNTGTASSVINSAGQIRVGSVPLDGVLKNYNPTFIKMDIEGAEIDALEGAKKTIQKCNPVLAICVYHKPNHLWKIPQLINSFWEDYHFFLKAHREEGWDLVCYAVPNDRLIA